MSGGILLTSVSIDISFWFVLVTYGLMVGVGAGIGYVAPIACVMRWLPKWKALGAGVVVAGFGLSATIFTAVQTAYINPGNLRPIDGYFTQRELLDNVPYVFLILGSIYAVLQLIGCVFLVNPPPREDYTASLPQNNLTGDSSPEVSGTMTLQNNVLADSSPRKPAINSTAFNSRPSSRASDSGSETPLLDSINSHTKKVSASWSSNVICNVKPQIMLCKTNFYHLWFMFMLAGVSLSFTATLYKQFGLMEVHADDHFLSAVGAVSAIFNLLGRILWGLLADAVS